MNQIRIASAVLFLLFATFAWAQEPRAEPQPQKQEDKAKPNHEVPHNKEAKPPKQDESKPAKQQEKADVKKDEQTQQRNSRPAGKSAHIPDAKFRASFGRQHTFVVGHPQIVGGQPRFQYGGFWFEIIDVWPVGWAYTDDCFIDYVDGEYFLFDVLHPGVRVALFVIL